ncbi:MAG: T9SS type A sorting domain-containing protein [Bacteroidota bacterium]|nr:T9SS type A sorting domain-containing protein [Bacteroidota bacterium]
MKPIISSILILITGALFAQNQPSAEFFASCQMPSGWESKILNGSFSFEVSKENNRVVPDASCAIVYKQLDKTDQLRRRFQLVTQEFTVSGANRYAFVFSLRYAKTINATFKLSVNNAGVITPITFWTQEVREPLLYNFEITTAQSTQSLSFIFEYDATVNDYGTEIILDDMLLSLDNDDCSRAITLEMDKNCLNGSIQNAVAISPGPVSCPGTFQSAIWYSFLSSTTGLVEFNTDAFYNDGVTAYEGSCGNLKELNCTDLDEHGFTGEKTYFNVSSGKNYFFRISKKVNAFGYESGFHCVSIHKKDKLPEVPLHDICDTKIKIQINDNCSITSNNKNAGTSGPTPSLNNRSRADVWYSFIPTTTKDLELITHADFAEVISVYKGTCNALQEVLVEDLGSKLVLSAPKVGQEYFVQISGYFSTVEGNLCLEVKEKSIEKPTNDECVVAKAIALNANCLSTQFINSSKSISKASCIVYHAPDVWYSFVASSEAKVALKIDAGFIYNWALYSGACNNLLEHSCGTTQDPCDGFIKVENLIAGKTYYLQILAANHPLNPGEGALCVRIDELSKTQAFQPLDLNLQVDCLHGVLGRVNYTAIGGEGQYTYTGPTNLEVFYPGTIIEAFLEDEAGCRDQETLEIGCVSPLRCNNSNLDVTITTECIKDSLGRQTGEVVFNLDGKGGSGAYYFYGTPNGSILKHGDTYHNIIIDSDSCYVIEEGQIYCPPFDCSQSNLKVTVSYECIDTLLKAQLTYNITGNLGTYSITGNQIGDLLDNNQNYSIEITDQAGCKIIESNSINCSFDSCAFAQPTLSVSVECLKEIDGNPLGKGRLKVSASSKAGGLVYIGNQPNEVLNHLDKYTIELRDAFSCGLSKVGIVNCSPLGILDEAFQQGINVFPNPTSEDIHVVFDMTSSEKIAYQLTSLQGEIIRDGNYLTKVGSNQMTISVKELSSGMYYIQLKGKEYLRLKKFVKN